MPKLLQQKFVYLVKDDDGTVIDTLTVKGTKDEVEMLIAAANRNAFLRSYEPYSCTPLSTS